MQIYKDEKDKFNQNELNKKNIDQTCDLPPNLTMPFEDEEIPIIFEDEDFPFLPEDGVADDSDEYDEDDYADETPSK